MLAYKKNAADVFERLKLFYSRKATDRIGAVFSPPSSALREFKATHKEGACTYPDPNERLAFWDGYLQERRGLWDDSIPSAYLSEFDQGLYGGVLGGEVRFNCDLELGWISSMLVPILKDWSELKTLRFDENHAWMKKYETQLDVFREGATGQFGVSNFILINGLNFAFELVGATETYTAMIDDLDALREAMELGFKVNTVIQKRFFERIPLLAGGTCTYGAQWMPGRIISESVDPFHMTAVSYFEEWGRPILERVIAEFDGGCTHIHGNGRHLLEAVCKVKGLKCLALGDDKGFPLCMDVVDELRVRTGDMPLIIGTSFDVFTDKLKKHTLPGGVLYLVSGVPDVDSANHCMESVRRYRL